MSDGVNITTIAADSRTESRIPTPSTRLSGITRARKITRALADPRTAARAFVQSIPRESTPFLLSLVDTACPCTDAARFVAI
jgi:hypothetical protein